MKKSLVVASLFALLPVVAHADPPSPMSELAPLIGNWAGTGTVAAGGTTYAVSASYRCEVMASGLGLKCHGEMNGFSALDPYVWDDLWGYSAGDGLYHWFTVTNAGETHDHRGSVKDGHAWMQFDGPQDGTLFSERVTMDFVAGKKLVIVAEVFVGGEPGEKFSFTFTPTRS